jgi:hypothetical protein
MLDKKQDLSENFSVKVTGEHKLMSESEKMQINGLLAGFLDKFDETFGSGVLFLDIKYKKGHFHQGTFRGHPLAYVHIRFSTDKGVFMANKENWGVKSALHDSLIVLTNQIRTKMHRMTGKEMAHHLISERKFAET